jgi:two-component system sensor histidine kinase KdpD
MDFTSMKSTSIISRSFEYLVAFILIAIITAMFFVLRDVLDTTLVALLYLVPIGIITARWGFAPGITSAVITFFVFNYFFIRPYYTLAVHRPTDVVILIIFLVVAVVISQLVGRAQAGLAAARAREREATQMYEFSTALASSHDGSTITQILMKEVYAISACEYIELNTVGVHPFSCHLPEVALPSREPEWVVPIEAAHSYLGEIRLWKATSFPPSEKRVVQTFASQGALALERAWLVQAESRARVLEESDRLKSAILSSVSHELRTPLSTIKAAASSLRGKEVSWGSPACGELIEAIDDEADHLNLLVGNLLDMSRIESGALRPKREWNILLEIVENVLVRMKHLAVEHKIKMDVPESLPLIPVDYVQMQQVFTNLVSNSLKYAPANTTVFIGASVVNEETIHIQVSNQGPQVPLEHLERIFDKFYRITAADRVTGTGLGLSICKGIIEAHGGRIWAENIPGGLAFNFTLPLIWDGIKPPQLQMDSEKE